MIRGTSSTRMLVCAGIRHGKRSAENRPTSIFLPGHDHKPDEGPRPKQIGARMEIVNGQRITVRVFEPRPAATIDMRIVD